MNENDKQDGLVIQAIRREQRRQARAKWWDRWLVNHLALLMLVAVSWLVEMGSAGAIVIRDFLLYVLLVNLVDGKKGER